MFTFWRIFSAHAEPVYNILRKYVILKYFSEQFFSLEIINSILNEV